MCPRVWILKTAPGCWRSSCPLPCSLVTLVLNVTFWPYFNFVLFQSSFQTPLICACVLTYLDIGNLEPQSFLLWCRVTALEKPISISSPGLGSARLRGPVRSAAVWCFRLLRPSSCPRCVCRCHRDGEAQRQVERCGWTGGSQGSSEGSRHPAHQVPSSLHRYCWIMLTLVVTWKDQHFTFLDYLIALNKTFLITLEVLWLN